MARYSGAERERRIEASRLLRQVTAIFAACGMSDDDAAVLADSLVQADLRGIDSHGVLRVPDYVAKLTVHGVDPRGVPRVAMRPAKAGCPMTSRTMRMPAIVVRQSASLCRWLG